MDPNVMLRMVRWGISRLRNTACRTADATVGAAAGVVVVTGLETLVGAAKELLFALTCCRVVALIIVFGGKELIASPSACFLFTSSGAAVCQDNEVGEPLCAITYLGVFNNGAVRMILVKPQGMAMIQLT